MFRIHYKIGDVTGFFHMYRSTNLRYTSQYSTEKMILKGVFAKNERGYRLNAIKKRF